MVHKELSYRVCTRPVRAPHPITPPHTTAKARSRDKVDIHVHEKGIQPHLVQEPTIKSFSTTTATTITMAGPKVGFSSASRFRTDPVLQLDYQATDALSVPLADRLPGQLGVEEDCPAVQLSYVQECMLPSRRQTRESQVQKSAQHRARPSSGQNGAVRSF